MFLKLTAINTHAFPQRTLAPTEPELDDLEQPVTPPEPTEPEPVTFPIVVNTDHIRSMYPRKGDKPGTRIVYSNSSADVVQESFDTIWGWIVEGEAPTATANRGVVGGAN